MVLPLRLMADLSLVLGCSLGGRDEPCLNKGNDLPMNGLLLDKAVHRLPSSFFQLHSAPYPNLFICSSSSPSQSFAS
jgi:hypothetical protein